MAPELFGQKYALYSSPLHPPPLAAGPNDNFIRYKRRVDIFSIGMVLLALVQRPPGQGKLGVRWKGMYVGFALNTRMLLDVRYLFIDQLWRSLSVRKYSQHI